MPDGETRDLFERARGGSTEALDAFYTRAARKLLPIIRLRLGRSLRAELESRDILQSVLLKSVDRLSQVREPRAVMAWLTRMAENEIRDRADYASRERRDAALRVPLDDRAESVPAPVRQALSRAILTERVEALERALAGLTDAQREIIMLRKFEELGFAEIGERLGKTEDACRVAFARAMAALTVRLGDLS
jgi:RNA polymerase sigma-70 factor (ECF subfamily)